MAPTVCTAQQHLGLMCTLGPIIFHIFLFFLGKVECLIESIALQVLECNLGEIVLILVEVSRTVGFPLDELC